jgi:hypothetical protein
MTLTNHRLLADFLAFGRLAAVLFLGALLVFFARDALGIGSSLMMPIRLPSGSLNSAKVTMPGMTVTGVTTIAPKLTALSSVACGSGTAA